MSGNRPVWRFFRFWPKCRLYRRIYAYMSLFWSKSIKIRWLTDGFLPTPSASRLAIHGFTSTGPTVSVDLLRQNARNPPCIFMELPWPPMSLPTRTSQDVIAGRDSHMLVVCNMLTGLLRCWHVRSSHVASGVTVTWLVRTDGFFATSRDTTSLDPGDHTRTQIFEHRSSRRSSAVVGFLCRGLPIVELALLGPWRWVMPCRSQKVQFDVWHLRKQIFENIENSRNGLISDGVTISSKCQFTTCS